MEVCYRQELIKCGREGCKSCPHGPYWYAYWWANGRTKKKYVGKTLKPEQLDYLADHKPEQLKEQLGLVRVETQPALVELIPIDQCWELLKMKPTRNQGMVRARYTSWKNKMEKGQILEGIDLVTLLKAWQRLCNENDWKP